MTGTPTDTGTPTATGTSTATGTVTSTPAPAPCSVFGSLASGGQSLRISASGIPGVSTHPLVFAGGGAILAVRGLTVTSCAGAGTPNATALVAGTAGSPSKGGGVNPGDSIVATLTLVHGSPGEADVTDTTTGKAFRLVPPFPPRPTLLITSP
jgi:hypothetical protein